MKNQTKTSTPNPWKRDRNPFVAGGLFLLFIIALLTINILIYQSQRSHIHKDMIEELSLIHSELDSLLNERVLLVKGIIAAIMYNPDMTSEEFHYYASFLIGSDPFIRNITLVKGSVITEVYPLEGNESAIGVDLVEIPSQKDTFNTARNIQQMVVSGPLDLVQGGSGLIFRMPIYINDAYWGQASLVINMDRLEQLTEDWMLENTSKKGIGIKGYDGGGAAGDYFINNLPEGTRDTESLLIQIPGGTWQMTMGIEKNWIIEHRFILLLWIFSLVLSIFIVIILLRLQKAELKILTMAYEDYLTGLPNRRTLESTFSTYSTLSSRKHQFLGIIVLDLDGFKAVNDRYGHAFGDRYLITFAEELKNALRASDTIFRLGGDEFLVLLPFLRKESDLKSIIDKIRTRLDMKWKIEDEEMAIPVSIGHALCPEESNNLEALNRIADERMYEDKKRRKDYSSKQTETRFRPDSLDI